MSHIRQTSAKRYGENVVCYISSLAVMNGMGDDINILLYGRDLGLLHTRRLVLEASGYRVLVATEFSEVQSAFVGSLIDLLILCHTLSHEECSKALALSISGWTATKSVVLAPGYPSGHMEALCESVDCCAEPAKLILTVGRIVGVPVTLHSHTY
jgi:hypothetical protein